MEDIKMEEYACWRCVPHLLDLHNSCDFPPAKSARCERCIATHRHCIAAQDDPRVHDILVLRYSIRCREAENRPVSRQRDDLREKMDELIRALQKERSDRAQESRVRNQKAKLEAERMGQPLIPLKRKATPAAERLREMSLARPVSQYGGDGDSNNGTMDATELDEGLEQGPDYSQMTYDQLSHYVLVASVQADMRAAQMLQIVGARPDVILEKAQALRDNVAAAKTAVEHAATQEQEQADEDEQEHESEAEPGQESEENEEQEVDEQDERASASPPRASESPEPEVSNARPRSRRNHPATPPRRESRLDAVVVASPPRHADADNAGTLNRPTKRGAKVRTNGFVRSSGEQPSRPSPAPESTASSPPSSSPPPDRTPSPPRSGSQSLGATPPPVPSTPPEKPAEEADSESPGHKRAKKDKKGWSVFSYWYSGSED